MGPSSLLSLALLALAADAQTNMCTGTAPNPTLLRGATASVTVITNPTTAPYADELGCTLTVTGPANSTLAITFSFL